MQVLFLRTSYRFLEYVLTLLGCFGTFSLTGLDLYEKNHSFVHPNHTLIICVGS